MMIFVLLGLLLGNAHAEEPCVTFFAPADVVEAAMRVQGARMLGKNEDVERRALLLRVACVADPLSPGDAAAVHVALGGERPEPAPLPKPGDDREGPPHPDGGVALVDGQAYARLRPSQPALVQAFDADGKVVYTRWLDARSTEAVRGGQKLPESPTIPRASRAPLSRSEIGRLIASGALLAASGGFLIAATGSRDDWYEIKSSPVTTVEELERLRVRTNVTQGAGMACAGLGAAGLLSVAVRVPF